MICANMDRGMSVDELSKYVKELFKFMPTQELTLKWLDDEGKRISITGKTKYFWTFQPKGLSQKS